MIILETFIIKTMSDLVPNGASSSIAIEKCIVDELAGRAPESPRAGQTGPQGGFELVKYGNQFSFQLGSGLQDCATLGTLHLE